MSVYPLVYFFWSVSSRATRPLRNTIEVAPQQNLDIRSRYMHIPSPYFQSIIFNALQGVIELNSVFKLLLRRENTSSALHIPRTLIG